MRLIHIVDSLEFGGLERVVTDLAIEQHRRGDQVSVFSLSATEGFAPELRAAGIEVVIGHKRGTADLRLLRELRALVRRRGIEVVHAHNYVPNYHAAVATWGMLRKPVLVTTTHDMGTRLSHARLRRLYAWSLKHTAGVAMVGRQVHEHFVGSGFVPAHKALPVLNGIPVAKFTNTPQRRAAARATLGIPEDAVLIGAVGRLVPLKNHRLLIEQMPVLRQRHPQLRLVIAGGGPLQDELRDCVRALGLDGVVQVLGHRGDVAALSAGFDIFALPSQTEGLSIALLEACATGLAVVATRVGGNPEIIREGETGLLVPPDDGPALAAALERLAGDAGLRQRLAGQAADWVRAHASVAALADAYAAFYQRAQTATGRS